MNRRFLINDAFWAVVGQVAFAIIFSSLVGIYRGKQAFVSAFAGGMICVLPNIAMFLRVFSYFGATQAQKIVNAFYWGETIKLIMTASLFAWAFLTPALLPMWIIIGYCVAQLGFWFGPILLGFCKSKNKSKVVGKTQ